MRLCASQHVTAQTWERSHCQGAAGRNGVPVCQVAPNECRTSASYLAGAVGKSSGHKLWRREQDLLHVSDFYPLKTRNNEHKQRSMELFSKIKKEKTPWETAINIFLFFAGDAVLGAHHPVPRIIPSSVAAVAISAKWSGDQCEGGKNGEREQTARAAECSCLTVLSRRRPYMQRAYSRQNIFIINNGLLFSSKNKN